MQTPPLLALTTALGAGLLVGLVYERRKAEDPSLIAGLRSHTLAALIGVVSLWLGLPVFAIAVLLCGAFVALGYYRTSATDPGVTSELALVLSCLIGGLALRSPAVAGGLAVLTAILIFAKSRLHRFSREVISNREVADGLILLAFALIVLPLLPDRTVDPWGLLNPAQVWKLAVLVMAISALGHVALRLVGTRWGLLVAGFFSGYVSSTAATAGFGKQSQAQPGLLASAVGATMLANLASLSMFVPILLAISPELLRETRWILVAAGAVLVLGAALGARRVQQAQTPPPTSETRMFRIGHALGFAAMITAVIVVSKLLGQWLGPGGALAATLLAATAELHSATAGVANLFRDGVLDASYARWAVVGLIATSSLAKSGVAFASGGKAFGWRIALGLGGMTLAAALAAVFMR
ncbi:MgtC/SapB family protein [Pseudoxanthomonas helianthi]|uniref:MgtC/SapB family protein n=1 Tax=Pseudoxanthomonas helianthi TaxID=1453541 RepID=A0A940X2Q6_9GAMM|nr:DUF4010 domain-containing protein [Pseudoxanthomonas helianthi]MBP3984052.1 MgtC/SapB family protein [Pseudoxanthomonas helianthi]